MPGSSIHPSVHPSIGPLRRQSTHPGEKKTTPRPRPKEDPKDQKKAYSRRQDSQALLAVQPFAVALAVRLHIVVLRLSWGVGRWVGGGGCGVSPLSPDVIHQAGRRRRRPHTKGCGDIGTAAAHQPHVACLLASIPTQHQSGRAVPSPSIQTAPSPCPASHPIHPPASNTEHPPPIRSLMRLRTHHD